MGQPFAGGDAQDLPLVCGRGVRLDHGGFTGVGGGSSGSGRGVQIAASTRRAALEPSESGGLACSYPSLPTRRVRQPGNHLGDSDEDKQARARLVEPTLPRPPLHAGGGKGGERSAIARNRGRWHSERRRVDEAWGDPPRLSPSRKRVPATLPRRASSPVRP